MSFDLAMSFDEAEYLNPQIYMLIDSLKENIPNDTTLHINTNRSDDDPLLQYIHKCLRTVVYKKPAFENLKSRCQYMFHSFEVETDKEWIMKIESDLLILKNLNKFDKLLKSEYDLVIEPENRKIHNDIIAKKLWRIIYNRLDISIPTEKIEYRENNERGLPLYGTGLVCVKSKHLNTINKRWVPLTKICEDWIQFNIHPNEFAFTAMAFDEDWNTYLYPSIYKFNPIGHFRKGDYPSTELIDDCKLPEGTVIFDYHRPEWLFHVAKYNPEIRNIIERNKEHIPDDWWKLTSRDFQEK